MSSLRRSYHVVDFVAQNNGVLAKAFLDPDNTVRAFLQDVGALARPEEGLLFAGEACSLTDMSVSLSQPPVPYLV